MAASRPESKLPDDLTADERLVIEDAHKGHATVFDVFDPPKNIKDPTTWTTVRARILVGLLLHPEQPLAPKGLRLRYAHITGHLDFTHATLTAPLQLKNCLFLEEVVFADATCPALTFPHSIFKNGFNAPRSRIDNTLNLTHTTITGPVNLQDTSIRVDLNLEGATLTLPPNSPDNSTPVLDATSAQIGSSLHLHTGFHAHGTVNIGGAKIGGKLSCQDGKFQNPNGTALNAQNIEANANVILSGEFEAEGEVSLSGAKIGGQLNCRDGKFRNPNGTALNAQNIETNADVFLAGRFEAEGEVSLSGAKIGGQLGCRGGKFQNPKSLALNAQGIETSGNMHLDDGFEAKGEVSLSGAKIGGQLSCRDGKFRNPSGTALGAQGIETSANMFLAGRFEAEGEVSLSGAKIGGQLGCFSGKFYNPKGLALNAESIETSGNMLFDDGFEAKGTVILWHAKIGGLLGCRGGKFQNPKGLALNAQGIETSGNMHLDDGFEAKGEVDLSGAKIGSQLSCRDGKFRNPSGTALGAQGIETSAGMFLDGRFEAEGEVSLSGAKIGGELNLRGGVFEDRLVLEYVLVRKLMDDEECWPKPDMVFLDGFQYEEIADESLVRWQDRLVWLEQQKEFVPGPYEQLAKVYQARGDAHAARKVLIAKHKRQIQSVKRSPVRLRPTGMSKVWRRHLLPHFQWLFGGLVGYGHAPWRAAWGLAGLVFFAWVTFMCAADSNRMVPVEEPHDAAAFADATKKKGVHADECTYGVEYPCFHALWYAVDVAVPLVDLRQQSYWAPTGGYRWVMWLVIVAGWLLVSAVAVGLTLLFRGSGV